MKRKQLSLAIHGALAVSMLFAAPAMAQEATATKPEARKTTTLESVKVTARKREETLQEVPVAVTAFTSEALDKLNIRDISDLGTQVPNLTIYAARGSNTTLTAYIRGVGQSDPLWGVDPGVGLYMDDVYIARPQGALLDVFDVDRIEVLRGPQGTLYGKNTIGGAIKYISKGLRADFNGFGSVTVGNYGQRDFKAAVGGGLGGSEYLRGRISIASLNNDGFGKNIVTGDRVSDKDILAYRMNLGAYVTDAFDLQFALDHMKDNSGVRGAQLLESNRFVPNTPPLASRYDVRNGMPNVNHTTMSGASMTANFRASEDWTFKYVLAKRESDTETNIDFDVTQAKIADVKAFYNDQQITNEIQAMYDGGGKSRGVMGFYVFDGYAGGQVLNNFFNLLFGDTQGKVYTKSYALYADWSFDLSERLKLDAGVRYTKEDKHAIVRNIGYKDATFQTPNGVVSANFDKTIGFRNMSPKISLDYQVNDNVMVYGSASRGFKSGGYNIRAQATAVPRSADPFKDEQVDSYEVGAKLGLLDQTMFLNLAAFHNKYKDIQLSVFTAYDSNGDGIDDAFFGDFTNAGSGTVNGLEVEYQWLPSVHWSITGNLAWLDPKYDEFKYAGVNIAHEQAFTNAPKFSGGINLEYRTPVGHGDLSARVGYHYQSKVVATTEILRAEVPPYGRPPITQEGYGLLSAGVIWNINPAWTVSLQGTNLTDKHYMTTGYNLNRALGVYTGFYGAPRQYSLSVRYNF
ncbi:MAG: TonB-dependent receptor [Xanthomonadaceae bacterium]|nr:TonB-dependent receptor [Xanthomonadaceae bacterium]